MPLLRASVGVSCPLGFAAPPRQRLQAAFALSLIAAFRFYTTSEKLNTKFSVFRFNPALQAFPPSHLGIVQTSLLSALGLASVSFLHYKRKTEHKVFRFPLFVFSFLCIFADVLCNRVQLCFGTKYGILLSAIYLV